METAVAYKLSNDLTTRITTAAHFLATKLEAFIGRGRGDFFASRDLEDFVAVIDGRQTVVTDVPAQTAELQTCLMGQIERLLGTPEFIDALPGYLLPDASSQSRIAVVPRRLRELASIQPGSQG